jgi:hypothetical protein
MFQSLAAYVGEGNKLMHLMRECFTRVKIGAHGEFFFLDTLQSLAAAIDSCVFRHSGINIYLHGS